MWKWISFLLLGTTTYFYLNPETKIVEHTEYLTRIEEKDCPVCREFEPCTIEYKEPDKVIVVSQDLPCRCEDKVTEQVVNELDLDDVIWPTSKDE